MSFVEKYVETRRNQYSHLFEKFKGNGFGDEFSLGNLYIGRQFRQNGKPEIAYLHSEITSELWYGDYSQPLKPIGVFVNACMGLWYNAEFGEMHIGKHILQGKRVALRHTTVYCDGKEVGSIYYDRVKNFFGLNRTAAFSTTYGQTWSGRRIFSSFYQVSRLSKVPDAGDSYAYIQWKMHGRERFLVVPFRRQDLGAVLEYIKFRDEMFHFSPEELDTARPVMISKTADSLPLEYRLFLAFLCCHTLTFNTPG